MTPLYVFFSFDSTQPLVYAFSLSLFPSPSTLGGTDKGQRGTGGRRRKVATTEERLIFSAPCEFFCERHWIGDEQREEGGEWEGRDGRGRATDVRRRGGGPGTDGSHGLFLQHGGGTRGRGEPTIHIRELNELPPPSGLCSWPPPRPFPCQVSDTYHMCRSRSMASIASYLAQVKPLSIAERYILSSVPISSRDRFAMQVCGHPLRPISPILMTCSFRRVSCF